MINTLAKWNEEIRTPGEINLWGDYRKFYLTIWVAKEIFGSKTGHGFMNECMKQLNTNGFKLP